MEIELKLLITRRLLHRVLVHRTVRRCGRGPSRSEALRSVYFDTPGFDLRRKGIALRLRRKGGGWVQTVKGGGSSALGLHRREEFEWKLPREALDLDVLERTPYRKLFDASLRRRLRPAFATAFRRTAVDLAIGRRTRAELALDVGEIRAGRRREAIAEVEIELSRGEPRDLVTFARTLKGSLRFRIGNASKAERGYALAYGGLVRASLRTQPRAKIVR